MRITYCTQVLANCKEMSHSGGKGPCSNPSRFFPPAFSHFLCFCFCLWMFLFHPFPLAVAFPMWRNDWTEPNWGPFIQYFDNVRKGFLLLLLLLGHLNLISFFSLLLFTTTPPAWTISCISTLKATRRCVQTLVESLQETVFRSIYWCVTQWHLTLCTESYCKKKNHWSCPPAPPPEWRE